MVPLALASTRSPALPGRPLRVTVLGVGAMGRLHVRVLAGLPRAFLLAGVYDPSEEAARACAEAWGVKAFDRESEAIAAADIVFIASPISAHAGAARRALAGGRHVFVEKPLSATTAEAFALTRGLGRGQQLLVGHSERFNPVVRALSAIIRPADVRTMRLRRTATGSRAYREHGVLVSLGVHDVDLVAHLTASPAALRDVLYVDDDRADLVLTASQGAVAWVHVDRCAPQRQRLIEVVTADATFVGDLLAGTLSRRSQGAEIPTACEVPRDEPLVAQAEAIARALSGSLEPLATGVDGARALAIVEQAASWAGPLGAAVSGSRRATAV